MMNRDLIYENGRIKRANVVVHDITEIKKAEAEKIKAQKTANEQNKMALVGQIAGKMAHDFNNILSIILGTTELSILDCDEPQTRKSLELILEQALRGKNLTRNLVIFAKDHEPRQEYFYIADKINLVLDLLKKDLEGIHLIVRNNADVPQLLADPGMIEHALVNLVQNSIHALSRTKEPKIGIQSYYENDRICFSVKDNGCGIPEKHLEQIYQPSFTLKGSMDTTGSYSPEIKGTGYGMSNVKKYIEQHKGEIILDTKVGKGTAFTIRLPVIQKELTPDEIMELEKGRTFSNRKILLVEDELSVSRIQEKILTQPPCSHKVDVASSGAMAIQMYSQKKYDLVSLDYILPGDKNGMDIYQWIRQQNRTIPVLFISGNIEFIESIKNLKQKDRFIDHLSKPCLNKDYVKAVNGLFDTARP